MKSYLVLFISASSTLCVFVGRFCFCVDATVSNWAKNMGCLRCLVLPWAKQLCVTQFRAKVRLGCLVMLKYGVNRRFVELFLCLALGVTTYAVFVRLRYSIFCGDADLNVFVDYHSYLVLRCVFWACLRGRLAINSSFWPALSRGWCLSTPWWNMTGL